MKTADAAAAKIQAGFRGYKVRRQLREEHDKGSSKEEHSSQAAAPPGPPGPQGPQCRSFCQMSTPAKYEGAPHEELLQRSASLIQAGVRGFLVRRRQHNAAMAAAKIQAGFRGYRARRDLKQRLRNNSKGRP